MTKRLISVGLFALTAGTLWSLSQQLRRSQREAPKAKPVPVQTWEGEGGALPATGAQMGPDPVVPAGTLPRAGDLPGTVH